MVWPPGNSPDLWSATEMCGACWPKGLGLGLGLGSWPWAYVGGLGASGAEDVQKPSELPNCRFETSVILCRQYRKDRQQPWARGADPVAMSEGKPWVLLRPHLAGTVKLWGIWLKPLTQQLRYLLPSSCLRLRAGRVQRWQIRRLNFMGLRHALNLSPMEFPAAPSVQASASHVQTLTLNGLKCWRLSGTLAASSFRRY